ncbi:hypothetical protein P170DRAFT_271446 [Aspergillus steynii IBT 23096]|uniref:Uncharacterized protein n=1 Tax=Aspergillus steynii IBT 23096 TaxID=1392250 RepID=A0A2I2FWK0_9EURO|nr:uncharacterized protein P170DRAFT_271446 [Aspergillus steynii IBT 23096]PLB45019.1 hypothetical protein P170DRAFT_271446 [Aspergillus steynii IBT 23096]
MIGFIQKATLTTKISIQMVDENLKTQYSAKFHPIQTIWHVNLTPNSLHAQIITQNIVPR